MRIYYNCLWCEISTTCRDATEVSHWATTSCSRPHLSSDNGVRDGIFNWRAVIPHSIQVSTPRTPLAQYKFMQPLQGISSSPLHIRGNHISYMQPLIVFTACFSIVGSPQWKTLSGSRRAPVQLSASIWAASSGPQPTGRNTLSTSSGK